MPDVNTLLFLAIYNSLGSSLVNIFFSLVTWAGHLLFWAVVGLLLVLKHKKTQAVDLLVASLIVILAVQALKYGFAVQRPFEALPGISPLLIGPQGGEADPSFPSGHAALAAMGALIVSSACPRLRAHLALLVFLVMLSRVYLGVHYPADVIAGAALGALIGYAVVKCRADNRAVEWLIKKLRTGFGRAGVRRRKMKLFYS